MRDEEKCPTGLTHSADKLRQLILDNPDLPLIVFASDDANNGDYSYMSCGSVDVEVGEILDCMQDVDDEYCFTDHDEFAERIEDSLYDFDGTDQELEDEVKRRAAEYEPYWKRCIIVRVGN